MGSLVMALVLVLSTDSDSSSSTKNFFSSLFSSYSLRKGLMISKEIITTMGKRNSMSHLFVLSPLYSHSNAANKTTKVISEKSIEKSEEICIIILLRMYKK